MIFRLEPTGMGISVGLPGCGERTTSSSESITWIVQPIAGEQPRLKNGTELKDMVGRAVLKRASISQDRIGRVSLHEAHDHGGRAGYVVHLHARDDVFARIAECALEGKPPMLVLEPDGSGRVWDNVVDPQITLDNWRAEVQVTADDKAEAASPPSLVEAQLALMRRSLVSVTIAAWAAAAGAALMVLLRLV